MNKKSNHTLMISAVSKFMQGVPDELWSEEDFEVHEFLMFVLDALESGENLYIESDPFEVKLAKMIKSELKKTETQRKINK